MTRPPPAPPPQVTDTLADHRFPCSACGSDLRYAPGSDRLHCDHCGHDEPIGQAGPWAGAGALKELDYETALRNALPADEIEVTRVTQCSSCGAQVELGAADHAAECPFCASPVVSDTGTHRHIKPRAVLPFVLTEAQARDAMTAWLGRLWFAPNGLKEYARKGRKMDGIYVPYWTYDARTRSGYSGQRGDAYWTTETRTVDGKRKQVRVQKIRWTRVRGQVRRDFDDVLALASASLPASHTDALEPWPLESLEAYRPEYLAGFRAEGYQIPLDEGYRTARGKMDRVIRNDVTRDIGGDRQRIDRIDTDVQGVTFKHVLLPVWLAAYRFRGDAYRFVVNAATGEVQGERPWSAWKIAVAVILGLLVVAGVLFVMETQ